MSHPMLIADAFAEKPFAGNPAAVCLLDREADAAWMQSVAMEMNLSETAFVAPSTEGFGLRWFTPVVEVDLCGHATLASAHVLWELGRLNLDEPACFHTRSGRLTAVRLDGAIELDFPALPAAAVDVPEGLESALGASAVWVGRNAMDCLVELRSAAEVRELQPDFAALSRTEVRGVIVTAPSDDPRFDFVSRFFAPAAGISEDPVTGSAHCCLGPYWRERIGREQLVGYQASRRGGVVRVRCAGRRVGLAGTAVTVVRGQWVAARD